MSKTQFLTGGLWAPGQDGECRWGPSWRDWLCMMWPWGQGDALSSVKGRVGARQAGPSVCKMRACVWMDFSINPSCQPLYVLRVCSEFPRHVIQVSTDMICFSDTWGSWQCARRPRRWGWGEETDEGGQSAGQPRSGQAGPLAVVGEAERSGRPAVGEGSKRKENRMEVQGRDGDFWLG